MYLIWSRGMTYDVECIARWFTFTVLIQVISFKYKLFSLVSSLDRRSQRLQFSSRTWKIATMTQRCVQERYFNSLDCDACSELHVVTRKKAYWLRKDKK